MDASLAGFVRSVNVSPVRIMQIGEESVPTGIMKMPVSGRIAVCGLNLAGDERGDRRVHGAPDRSLYAYASEHGG